MACGHGAELSRKWEEDPQSTADLYVATIVATSWFLAGFCFCLKFSLRQAFHNTCGHRLLFRPGIYQGEARTNPGV